jgi:hypothetical protein
LAFPESRVCRDAACLCWGGKWNGQNPKNAVAGWERERMSGLEKFVPLGKNRYHAFLLCLMKGKFG